MSTETSEKETKTEAAVVQPSKEDIETEKLSTQQTASKMSSHMVTTGSGVNRDVMQAPTVGNIIEEEEEEDVEEKERKKNEGRISDTVDVKSEETAQVTSQQPEKG